MMLEVPLDLKKILELGWARTPQVTRLALGILVLCVVTTTVLSARIAPSVLFPSVVVVLVLGTVVTLVAQALGSPYGRRLGVISAGIVVAIFVVVVVLFLLSAFTNLLPRGTILVARAFDAPELIEDTSAERIVISAGETKRLDELKVRFPLELPDDRFEAISLLAGLPNIVVARGGKLVLGAKNEFQAYNLNTLELDGGEILTGGATVDLRVARLVASGNGVIRAHSGLEGLEGTRDGGTFSLTVLDKIEGSITVDLSGRVGDAGLDGGPGMEGASGRPGDNAASGFFDCKRGAGAGGAGEPGQPGAQGGDGQPGGNGGFLKLSIPRPEVVPRAVRFISEGGAGGAGGKGGPGGKGGSGGPGGSPRGLCSGGGATGPSGPPGVSGLAGSPGRGGAPGHLEVQPLDGELS